MMAAADDARNEIFGTAAGHAVAIWKNVSAWKASPKTLQDKVSRVLRELTEDAALDYDINRPDRVERPLGIRAAVYRLLFEATLWLPKLTVAQLEDTAGKKETVLGHAVRAHSYAAENNKLLRKIAEKLDVE